MNRRSIRFNSLLALVTLLVYREGLNHIGDAPKETRVTWAYRKKKTPRLWLAAARAPLPGVPIAKQFELLVKAGFFDENVEFGARKALAERFGAVGDAPGSQCRDHGVQFQFAHIHLIQGVRSGVIIWQVVGLFLICHQRR